MSAAESRRESYGSSSAKRRILPELCLRYQAAPMRDPRQSNPVQFKTFFNIDTLWYNPLW